MKRALISTFTFIAVTLGAQIGGESPDYQRGYRDGACMADRTYQRMLAKFTGEKPTTMPECSEPAPQASGYAPFVPAIELDSTVTYGCSEGTICLGSPVTIRHFGCADKARVLLTSEDGKHWCMKVPL